MTDVYHELLEALSGTPSRIQALVEGMAQTPPSSEASWGPAQVIAHLVDIEQLYRDRMQKMLSQPSPPYLPSWDPDAAAEKGNYQSREVRPELEEFAKQRAETISLLMNLALKDWERTGIHDEMGEVSVEDLAEVLIDHDSEHLRQIEARLDHPA